MLTRYWIEFETNQYEDFTFHCFFKRGIGVTAYNYDDAIKLLEKIFLISRKVFRE